MFVAIDTRRERAVAGAEVDAAIDSPGADNPADEPVHRTSTGEGRFQCLCCRAPLRYTGGPTTGALQPFTHERGGCVSDGNMSIEHRLGQEMLAKAIFNLLPTGRAKTRIDLERRIGVRSDFIVADVRVTAPIQLAVEVVNRSPKLHLRERLQQLFAQGYAGMIVVVTTGSVSATRLNRHLGKIGAIRVGRFDPATHALELGSIVTPERVDFETPGWSRVPAYLS